MLYQYPGFHECPSHCDLEILRRSVTPLVICTELADNPGTSVTNMAEHLATRVYEDDPSMAPEHLIWVEHYLERSAGRGRVFPETWDLVTFRRRSGRVFGGPTWRRLTAEQVTELRRAVGAASLP